MLKILYVEDDQDLNMLTTSFLKSAGFIVTSVYNGLDGLNEMYENKYDMILTDIMMPLLDGFEFAKQVREYDQEIPIIFMSARDDKPSKQIGYKIGIDDYIVKPFDLDELVLKIEALARRLKIGASNALVVGNLKMNKEERTVYIDEEEVAFTVREFDILYCMLQFPKKTFTRGKLMEDFWDYDSSATSRTVDVYMARLRDKTKNCTGFEIQTVHGLGYKVVLK